MTGIGKDGVNVRCLASDWSDKPLERRVVETRQNPERVVMILRAAAAVNFTCCVQSIPSHSQIESMLDHLSIEPINRIQTHAFSKYAHQTGLPRGLRGRRRHSDAASGPHAEAAPAPAATAAAATVRFRVPAVLVVISSNSIRRRTKGSSQAPPRRSRCVGTIECIA